MNDVLAPGSSVLVVGGGIVGASTAYALTAAGFEVTLLTDRRVGDGASAGNAGLLVPADSVVWAGPANRRAVPATILGRGGSSIQVAWANPRTIPWGLRFLANSSARAYDASCRAAHALSAHSLATAERWVGEADLGTELPRTGMLFLVGSAADAEEARHARAALIAAGETYVELDHDDLVAMDPAYRTLRHDVVALYAAGAAQGDSQAFARALALTIRSRGANVLDGRPVTGLVREGDRVVGASTSAGTVRADAVVLTAGVASRDLARAAGVRVPILPVKGYAATVPITVTDGAPRIGGVLENKHVAFSRMGDHLRLSTGAEIGRSDHDVDDEAVRLLRGAGEELFPAALDWQAATFRAEHRPMTPTGLPLIGPTRRPGLHLVAGHGSLGWTQAAGSADLLVHLLTGATPPVDPRPYLPVPA